jgi:hypothetical protein
VGGGNCKHRADGGHLHNRAESLVVVNPRALRETPEDPVSLVPIECSVGDELVCENPLVGDDVGGTGLGNKFPCPIAHQVPYSSIATCQFKSARAVRTKVRMVEGDVEEVVVTRVSRS